MVGTAPRIIPGVLGVGREGREQRKSKRGATSHTELTLTNFKKWPWVNTCYLVSRCNAYQVPAACQANWHPAAVSWHPCVLTGHPTEFRLLPCDPERSSAALPIPRVQRVSLTCSPRGSWCSGAPEGLRQSQRSALETAGRFSLSECRL